MKLDEAISLIKHPEISAAGKKLWADLGSGTGLFSNALARLITPGSKIFAVDSNMASLNRIEQPQQVTIEKIKADFSNGHLHLQNLDGVLMANSLHYVEDKLGFVKKLAGYLSGHGNILIVEYNTDEPNPWVPFPSSFRSLEKLFRGLGYSVIHKINELPSRYDHATIYAAWIKK
ncbi:MAG TPA: class I SAM-dependent methyltransferase [Puia sp.]|nr:class I SAM-dependent methyltransferase [Puia sp.]